MKTLKLYVPTTKTDVLKRGAMRFGFCALPYLAGAWLYSFYQDDRLFHGFGFWWCVILIPGLGIALDLWRLKQTRDSESAGA